MSYWQCCGDLSSFGVPTLLPEAPDENPAVTIARLEGQLEERREHAGARSSKK